MGDPYYSSSSENSKYDLLCFKVEIFVIISGNSCILLQFPPIVMFQIISRHEVQIMESINYDLLLAEFFLQVPYFDNGKNQL